MRNCFICGKFGNMGKHHIIHGHGKRKACETRDSLIDICVECHKFVHSSKGAILDRKLKDQLQKRYYSKGYDEERIRKLMGGKLFSLKNILK